MWVEDTAVQMPPLTFAYSQARTHFLLLACNVFGAADTYSPTLL